MALAIAVIAVEAVTELLVTSALLDIIGLRGWATRRAIPDDPVLLDKVRWYHTAFHKLLTCGYCASVWVAAMVAWMLPGDYFGLLPWNNIAIKIFLVHRLANWLHVVEQVCKVIYRKSHGHLSGVELFVRNTDSPTNPLIMRVELSDDAREILRGAGAPGGGTAGRHDLPAPDGPDGQ